MKLADKEVVSKYWGILVLVNHPKVISSLKTDTLVELFHKIDSDEKLGMVLAQFTRKEPSNGVKLCNMMSVEDLKSFTTCEQKIKGDLLTRVLEHCKPEIVTDYLIHM